MQHPADFGAALQPAGEDQPVLVVLAQPHPERAQPAEREIDIVRPAIGAEIGGGLANFGPQRLAGGDRADHHVGMADDVFGRRLHRDIDAVLERLEQHAGGPGIVHDHHRAGRVGGGGDRRDIGHLEGERARRFDIDDAGPVADQPGHTAADRGIEIGRLDPETPQEAVAEAPRRAVDIVRHQDVIAGLDEGEDGGVDRRQAGAEADRPLAALDRRHRLLQRRMGRSSVPPIGIDPGLEPPFARLAHRRHGRVRDRGGVVDGRVDDTEIGLGIAPGRGDDRVFLHGAARGMVSGVVKRPRILPAGTGRRQ